MCFIIRNVTLTLYSKVERGHTDFLKKNCFSALNCLVHSTCPNACVCEVSMCVISSSLYPCTWDKSQFGDKLIQYIEQNEIFRQQRRLNYGPETYILSLLLNVVQSCYVEDQLLCQTDVRTFNKSTYRYEQSSSNPARYGIQKEQTQY